MSDFWEGRDPCWVILGCSKYVYTNCPAYHYRDRPCWETAYTQCEVLIGIKRDCKSCKIFKRYSVAKTDIRPVISPPKDS
ncbi:MAG: hypothetical protein A2026_02300 [Deltaproteobacteria bacterium RBG_19FT_COMBO_46_12]|nr:MAG: hypothetical protein A2026_02300 [Deltaproteobacteria bacterium RBG_19FT_COMBO_46_12]